MRKELYQKRVSNRQCVNCAKALSEGCTTKKCSCCLEAHREYKRKTRSIARAQQEREYRASVWFKRCLYKSKNADKAADRSEDGTYMTTKRLRTLRVLQGNECFYCQKKLQVKNRQKHDGLTIERLNNTRPHMLSNCVLCCHRCNASRVSNHHTIDINAAYNTILERFENNDVLFNKFLALMEVDTGSHNKNSSACNSDAEGTDTVTQSTTA